MATRNATVQNLERTSIRQLLALLGTLTLGAWASLLSFLILTLSFVFWLGQKTLYSSTAIALDRPFGMVLHDGPPARAYEHLGLLEKARGDGAANGTVILDLRSYQGPTLTSSVGEVTVKRAPTKFLFDWIMSLAPGSTAHAASHDATSNKFNWGKYKDSYHFSERYIDATTIRRRYDDGSVLEYSIDSSRKMLPATLRWVRLK